MEVAELDLQWPGIWGAEDSWLAAPCIFRAVSQKSLNIAEFTWTLQRPVHLNQHTGSGTLQGLHTAEDRSLELLSLGLSQDIPFLLLPSSSPPHFFFIFFLCWGLNPGSQARWASTVPLNYTPSPTALSLPSWSKALCPYSLSWASFLKGQICRFLTKELLGMSEASAERKTYARHFLKF